MVNGEGVKCRNGQRREARSQGVGEGVEGVVGVTMHKSDNNVTEIALMITIIAIQESIYSHQVAIGTSSSSDQMALLKVLAHDGVLHCFETQTWVSEMNGGQTNNGQRGRSKMRKEKNAPRNIRSGYERVPDVR